MVVTTTSNLEAAAPCCIMGAMTETSSSEFCVCCSCSLSPSATSNDTMYEKIRCSGRDTFWCPTFAHLHGLDNLGTQPTDGMAP